MSTADESPSLELRPNAAVRAANAVLGLRGARPFDLSPSGFRRRAERTTGLNDFGDEPVFHALLDVLANEVDANPNISKFGRFAAAMTLQFKMENKLRLVELMREHPSIASRPIERPIFIIGWYRTGTTKLHNLLSSAHEHRAFSAWELITPYRLAARDGMDRRLRRIRANMTIALARYVMPEVKAAHPLDIDWPEEDFFLLENDLVGPTLFYMYQAEQYADLLCEWDVSYAYRNLRKQLQVLSGEGETRRLILKAPIHYWNVDTLYRAFPDAYFVFTQRDPRAALLSNCSFSAMTTSKISVEPNLSRLGAFWWRYNQIGLERAVAGRKEIPSDQQLDVPLSGFAGNAERGVARIYDYFGIPFTASMRTSLREMDASRQGQPQAQHRHHYSASQFGLDDDAIDASFEWYREWLARLESDWAH